MRWSYKTVHYDLKKEGLLGSAFLDESEVEQSLNEYGKAGWELVSILETQEGLIAIFKQPLSLERETAFQPEEEDEQHYVPLRRDNAPPVQTLQGKQPEKVVERVVVPVAPIDEYEIVVDEPRLAKKKSPPAVDNGDIGSIRIE